MIKNNYTMMCDFYELTMSNGYLVSDIGDTITYFDLFYRTVPDAGGFSIAAGLETVINYIKNIKFYKEDIDYLKSKKVFDDRFLEFLSSYKFTGDIYAVEEGTPIFPNEPIMIVKARAIEAQFIETYVLSSINHESLIATKSNRIVRAALGRPISEFGARRAHGASSAIQGARASYIAGCVGTSCVMADRLYDIPATGTMAHSWVQMFDTEYEAFSAYAKIYPNNTILLVDTYNVINSGVPNAIKVFNDVLKPLGIRPKGIRIDSGDVAYLSKKARGLLDKAGYTDVLIFVSNSLDEYIIRDLCFQEAKIDAFGVGERLITSKSSPVFDGVYKLVAIEKNNNILPKIKISETTDKITTPHFKKLYRFYDKDNGKAFADLITVFDEDKPKDEYTLFDPIETWKRKTVTNFEVKELLIPIFIKGELVYKIPSVKEIRKYCLKEVESLWDEVKRFENPHKYYVDLSEKLWNVKNDLLKKC